MHQSANISSLSGLEFDFGLDVPFVPMLVLALCPGASSWCGEDEKALLFSRHFIEEGTQRLRAPDRYDLASLTLP